MVECMILDCVMNVGSSPARDPLFNIGDDMHKIIDFVNNAACEVLLHCIYGVDWVIEHALVVTSLLILGCVAGYCLSGC